MKSLETKGNTEPENNSRDCSHVILCIIRHVLIISFFVGVYLAVDPTTRHFLIVIFVPIYAPLSILYCAIHLKCNHNEVPVPIEDESIIKVTKSLSPIEVEAKLKITPEISNSNLTAALTSINDSTCDSDESIIQNKYQGGMLHYASETIYSKTMGMRNILSNALRDSFVTIPFTARDTVQTKGDESMQPKCDKSMQPKDDDCLKNDEENNIIEVSSIDSEPEITEETKSYSERSNLSGTFKLVKSNNFDIFLKAMDVPWALRKAANMAKPIHTYTHTEDTFRVQIDGIVKGDTTYVINGPPIESSIRHIKFMDTATYADSGNGITVRKIAQNPDPGGATELIVARSLSSDKSQISLKSKAIFADGTESLESEQVFQRQRRMRWS